VISWRSGRRLPANNYGYKRFRCTGMYPIDRLAFSTEVAGELGISGASLRTVRDQGHSEAETPMGVSPGAGGVVP
jgi:hypothetical protein